MRPLEAPRAAPLVAAEAELVPARPPRLLQVPAVGSGAGDADAVCPGAGFRPGPGTRAPPRTRGRASPRPARAPGLWAAATSSHSSKRRRSPRPSAGPSSRGTGRPRPSFCRLPVPTPRTGLSTPALGVHGPPAEGWVRSPTTTRRRRRRRRERASSPVGGAAGRYNSIKSRPDPTDVRGESVAERHPYRGD